MGRTDLEDDIFEKESIIKDVYTPRKNRAPKYLRQENDKIEKYTI